jgi:hypothetical protein
LTDEAEKARDYLMSYQEEWQNIWRLVIPQESHIFKWVRANFSTIDWILNKE